MSCSMIDSFVFITDPWGPSAVSWWDSKEESATLWVPDGLWDVFGKSSCVWSISWMNAGCRTQCWERQNVNDCVDFDLWLHRFLLKDLCYQVSEHVEFLHTVSFQLCFSLTGCFSIAKNPPVTSKISTEPVFGPKLTVCITQSFILTSDSLLLQ